MQDTLLAKVNSLFKFVSSVPSRNHLVAFLSECFCPAGERAGVSFSVLHDDGSIHCELSSGFANNEMLLGTRASLMQDRPGARALRSLDIIYLTLKDLDKKYDQFNFRELASDFSSALVIPIGISKMYGIAIQGDSSVVTGFKEYAECVRSLLESFEHLMQGSIPSGPLNQKRSPSRELTERQKLIVAMIKAGKTNGNIAQELAYSESTIRHETIIIYRKLGVNGRKELPEMDLSVLPDGDPKLLRKE